MGQQTNQVNRNRQDLLALTNDPPFSSNKRRGVAGEGAPHGGVEDEHDGGGEDAGLFAGRPVVGVFGVVGLPGHDCFFVGEVDAAVWRGVGGFFGEGGEGYCVCCWWRVGEGVDFVGDFAVGEGLGAC